MLIRPLLPPTRAMRRVLAFLARHAGFHAVGALGLDTDCPDECDAVPMLVERGWADEMHGMVGITAPGLAAHLRMRQAAVELA